MTAIILFVSSTVLIVAFLFLKRFELSRGSRLFEGMRGKMDIHAERGMFYTAHVLPKKVAYYGVAFVTTVAHVAMLTLLRGIRSVEHKLLGVSNAVKGKKEIHRKQASTSYLEDVTKHKQQITRDRQNGDLKS